jgi:hypothetical protein
LDKVREYLQVCVVFGVRAHLLHLISRYNNILGMNGLNICNRFRIESRQFKLIYHSLFFSIHLGYDMEKVQETEEGVLCVNDFKKQM